MNDSHIPVLLSDVLAGLLHEGYESRQIIDGTLGAGGHTKSLLEAGVESVLGCDIDPVALSLARQNLQAFEGRMHIVESSYHRMTEQAVALGWDVVDGILLDLGVSSMQLDHAERGFSFMRDGPLDMRFNASGTRAPASELVNDWEQAELAEIFYKYGEERHGRRIAAAVVKNRPYETTGQLAAVIADAMPRLPKKQRGRKKIHPATRVFQALRIAVNDELITLEKTLPAAIDLLRPGGRLVVISFHSLEDRIVKQVFKAAATEIVSPPGMMLDEKVATVKLITRKPIVADEEEILRNPRSRSAKLRVVEKR
jgi:16S rRNA (cytosine1402-N4)-methyltransferase